MLTITKDFGFSASHRLYREDWTPEKNLEVYGKCFNNPSHGHTYKLSVTLKGKVDESGMLINFTELKRIVNEHVIDVFDHRFLNDFYPKSISTCEVMAQDIYETLKPFLKGRNYKLYKIDLYEAIYPTNSYASYQE